MLIAGAVTNWKYNNQEMHFIYIEPFKAQLGKLGKHSNY